MWAQGSPGWESLAVGILLAAPSVHLPAGLWDRPCHGDAEFAGGDQAKSRGVGEVYSCVIGAV